MSVFRVSLNNFRQGTLDVNPQTGTEFATSIQRTAYVPGPNKTWRKLKDGTTFTDNNYWKRYAYPQMPLEEAFIVVVSDDGAIYNDGSSDAAPIVYNLTLTDGSSFVDNFIDLIEDQNSYAVFTQINNGGNGECSIKINGSDNAIFYLGPGETQVFNHGDLSITKLEFANSSGETLDIQVIASIKSIEWLND